ncbi:hypothetical protein [Chlorogloea sp. CCALA 695]|uniref:hypothetical protein n=1 Tax=Chlorogloea sp. CCALA 695 TaxID=2107693 RepID=UPI0011B1EF98|nr:hypothetical protein [Chlorogloea sp. CCALA 695]
MENNHFFLVPQHFTHFVYWRWKNGRSNPSPLAMRKVEEMLRQMGDRGEDLLNKYLAKWVTFIF